MARAADHPVQIERALQRDIRRERSSEEFRQRHRDPVYPSYRQALRLAAVGLACGCVAALALTRVLASLLYDVNVTDPGVFGAAALLLLGVVVAAACIPAFRASRVDPVTMLRCE